MSATVYRLLRVSQECKYSMIPPMQTTGDRIAGPSKRTISARVYRYSKLTQVNWSLGTVWLALCTNIRYRIPVNATVGGSSPPEIIFFVLKHSLNDLVGGTSSLRSTTRGLVTIRRMMMHMPLCVYDSSTISWLICPLQPPRHPPALGPLAPAP